MKKFRLLYIDLFPKMRVEKSCNSIALVRVQAFMCSDCKKGLVCYRLYNRSIGLKIVNPFSLLKAASNPSSLEFLDMTVDVFLSFESPFTA